MSLPHSHSCNIINTVQVNIVKTLEQIKIPLIVLVNYASVDGDLICPFIALGTLKARCRLTNNYCSLVTENSIC